MGVSLMASLLVHAAAILFIPVALPVRTVIYPVQFGEIAQTFEAPRQGFPEGTAVAGPVGRAQGGEAGAARTGSETSVSVKPATAPRAAAKPAQTPASKLEPKPAPQKHAAPTTTASKTAATSAPVVASTPAKGPTSKGMEGVLTGKSDDTVPAASRGDERGGVAAVAASPAAQTAQGSDGSDEDGGGAPEGSAHAGEEAGPADQSGRLEAGAPGGPLAGPPKPRGAEFGTGEGLAVFAIPPVYPKGAENVWTEGRVAMTVTVDSQGNATRVAVVSSSGVPALDEAAARTVSRAWRFKGIGWPYELSVSVVFRRGSVELSYGGVAVLGE